MEKQCEHKSGGHFKLSKPKRKKNKKDNPVLNERKFNEFFEIRKERIGIIFKVIYVIAAFFLASVMALQGNEDAGISTVYIIESCAASFLLCLLVVLLIYVFNELQCLKITESVEEKQALKTENSYKEIFNYFYVGGTTAIISVFLVENLKTDLTKEMFTVIVCVFLICGMVLRFIGNLTDKYEKARHTANSIVWTLAICSLILLTKFG